MTAESVMAFAKTLEGKALRTLSRRCEFRVMVHNPGVVFTPGSSGLSRRELIDRIERVIERFATIKSFHPSDYHDLSRNASYLLAILKLLEGSTPAGE